MWTQNSFTSLSIAQTGKVATAKFSGQNWPFGAIEYSHCCEEGTGAIELTMGTEDMKLSPRCGACIIDNLY